VRMHKQGYQLMAVGQQKYIDIAIHCAASLRYYDQSRPIQLVTDRSAAALGLYAELFDVISPYVANERFKGPMIKVQAYEYAVFDETIFVDADCLLMKGDMDAYWNRLSQDYDVTVPGNWRSKGPWYGMQIEDMCRLADVSRLVQMNSGSFYFKKSAKAKLFFDTAIELENTLGNFTNHIHRGIGPSDEPLLAVTFGKLNFEPFEVLSSDHSGWMVSTIKGNDYSLGAFGGVPAFSKGERVVSPSLVHFVGLEPYALYLHLSREFLNHFRLPATPILKN
jgi:hypothetical protein